MKNCILRFGSAFNISSDQFLGICPFLGIKEDWECWRYMVGGYFVITIAILHRFDCD